MKHTAVNAGIGTLGKNTLLINAKYGNRLTVGVISAAVCVQWGLVQEI